MRRIIPADENPVLRERAHEVVVEEIGSERIQKLIAEMRALLSKEKYGVALAASQVGEPLRLFIVSGAALFREAENTLRASRTKSADMNDPEGVSQVEPTDQVYINPEMVKLSRAKKNKHEGCLSIRGWWGEVPRAEKATIRAYDEHGRPFTRGASGFLAHIFQHEMDHLEGILYTDKATMLRTEEPESA